jgi:WD40 repeat protein
MSEAGLEYLLAQRGSGRELGAHVAALAFDAAGTAGFGLGDGTVHQVASLDAPWRASQVADGAVLAICADAAPAGFVFGGDDGGFVRIGMDGDRADLGRWPGKWVEHVAGIGRGRDGVLACTVGRKLHLFGADGAALKTLDHPSTVTGLAFDGKGKRVAASHYNGASLWFVASKSDNPRRLEWKGSHTGLALHPSGEAVVTAMQENELHGWRLADGQHMRMSGYPTKTESLSFSRGGKWLASSGADAVVLWPFFGGGPMGRAPTELAGGRGVLCTRVACHPQHELCAAGFDDGMVLLADINSGSVLPVAPAEHGSITALAWNANGARLAFGTETGFAALVDLSAR